MNTPPVDHNGIRIALVRAVQRATGLDQNHVVMAEPETPNEPRPTKPYMTLKLTGAGMRYGRDVATIQNADGLYNYGGPRLLLVSFNAYGTTHEEAYDLLSLWQAALGMEPTLAYLRQSGVAVWLPGQITDLSELLDTGYEGRAHMDCKFGVASNALAELGAIETAVVSGSADVISGTVSLGAVDIELGG